MSPESSTLLRFALATNLAFSLTCAIAAIWFAPALAGVIGALPAWLIAAVGIGLLIFAAGIGWTLLRLRIGQALLISTLDLLWVLGTVPLIFVPGLLTSAGGVLVLAIAALVGSLGALQLLGIRAMLGAGATRPGEYRHCIRVHSAADPAKLWAVIRDLGSVARYSAGLRASLLEGSGDVTVGSVRVCSNTRQQSWAEEVMELDDQARSLVLSFRSEAPDFPFPLAALTGGWSVTHDGNGGAQVDIWWNAVPKQRWLGWLVVALMTIPLDHDMPRVVGAMEADAMGAPLPAKPKGLALGYC